MANDLQKEKTENREDCPIILQPYLLKRFGINKNRCLLQIDLFSLSCVPYRFSRTSCTVLLILSKREQEFIKKEEYSNVSFHMEINQSGYKKPWSLFFRSRIIRLHEFNLKHNQCLMTLEFLSTPGDYQALLDSYFASKELSELKYNSLKYTNQKFSFADLQNVPFDKYVNIQIANNEKQRGRLIEFSIKKISAAMDISQEALSNIDEILMEIPISEGVIPITGKILNYVPSKEIPGLYLVQFQIECSLSYIEMISPLLRE